MAAEELAPGQGFDIRIENDLPVSQGFGMSASGALAAALCITDMTGQSRGAAFTAVHVAEVNGGGGLGDVSAIVAGRDVPVRTVPGLPPHGQVVNAGFTFPKLTLAVLGGLLETDSILGDTRKVGMIRRASADTLEGFLDHPTADTLFEMSNRFSSESELESPAVRRAIETLKSKGYRAGMCMLGNSIFTDAPQELLWALFGRGHVRTWACSSSPREITVSRPRVARRG